MMRKRDLTFKPISLAQHFEAPDDFLAVSAGSVAILRIVAFSTMLRRGSLADVHAQRAYEGRIAMALMLDPGNPQITPEEVPGVMHLPINGVPPFRLLHAKLALLGFRHTSDARQWRLRLIVSTGNWTRQTLEDSLDLAWRIDLCDQDLKSENGLVPQACCRPRRSLGNARLAAGTL